jgi:hypothetical protein
MLGTCASLWLKTVYSSVGSLFWLPLLLLVALTASVIIFRDGGFAYLYLLALTVPLVGTILYPQSFQLLGYDEYFDVSYAKTIVDNASWNPALGTGYAKISGYGYYPANHLVLSAWAIVSGAPILSLDKYLAPLLISVAVLSVAVSMSKRIFPMENAKVIGLTYVTSLGFMAVIPSRRAVALILGVLAIALIFCKPSTYGNKRGRFVAATILLTTLSFSDHFIGAVILGSAIIVIIVLRLRKSEPSGASRGLFYFGAVSFAAWWAITAYDLFIKDVGQIENFWQSLLSLDFLEVAPTSYYGYTVLEKALTIVSWGVFGLCGLTGLILLLRGHRDYQSLVWGALGLVMSGFATTMTLHPWLHVLTMTLLWFATMLLSGPAASAVVKLAKLFPRGVPSIVPVLLLIVVFSGSLISAYGFRVLNRSPNDSGLVGEIEGFSREQTFLGNWLESHLEPNATILGDQGSFVLFSSMNAIEVAEEYSWPGNPGLFSALQSGLEPLHYVIWSTCYVTCGSQNYERTSPLVVENLSNYNRLWDGGEWQFLYPRGTGS